MAGTSSKSNKLFNISEMMKKYMHMSEPELRKLILGTPSTLAPGGYNTKAAMQSAYNKKFPDGPLGYKKKKDEPKVFAIPKTDQTRLSDAEQKSNAKYVADYLTKKGWSKGAIAGLLGNLQQESQLNPGVWQFQDRIRPLKKGQGAGYGLLQWDPAEKFIASIPSMEGLSDAEKAKAINNLAANNPEKLMNHELDFLIHSMKPGEGQWLPEWAVTKYGADYEMPSSSYINSDKTRDELTEVFATHYERPGAFYKPGDGYTKEGRAASLAKRREDANKWYDFLW